MTIIKYIIAVFGAALFHVAAYAQQDALIIRKADNFDIDGTGKAGAWASAEWIELTRGRGTADYDTRVKLLYSETGLYALYHCADNTITATIEEDFADLWHEDVVEMFLWTDESVPLYFEYELSPLNYELPILIPNLSGRAYGWRPWHYEGARKTRHATHIVRDDDDEVSAWIAEFFIPFTLLRPLGNVPPKAGTTWRINLYRIDYDEGTTTWSWKPVEKNFHEYQKFGTVRFE